MTHHSSFASSTKISTDLNLVSVHELFEHTQDVFNLIAHRAFEIFEARGRVHGNDREDWLLAESELLTPLKFHLSESGEQLTARADVPGFSRQEIKGPPDAENSESAWRTPCRHSLRISRVQRRREGPHSCI